MDLPLKNGGSFHSYVAVYQRVYNIIYINIYRGGSNGFKGGGLLTPSSFSSGQWSSSMATLFWGVPNEDFLPSKFCEWYPWYPMSQDRMTQNLASFLSGHFKWDKIRMFNYPYNAINELNGGIKRPPLMIPLRLSVRLIKPINNDDC